MTSDSETEMKKIRFCSGDKVRQGKDKKIARLDETRFS